MTNKKIISEVESLYLSELGITEANEIDLEAIAYYKNAVVKRKKLVGCEARIIGVNEKAIITVNDSSPIERQRFSIGHELGHWFKDKGKVSGLCSKSDIDPYKSKNLPHKEVVANDFASELLLPSYLLCPILNDAPFNMDSVSLVSNDFKTSMMVALLKIIEVGEYMGFSAVYDKYQKRKKFKPSKNLPYEFFPPQNAPMGSIISEVIEKRLSNIHSGIVDGEVWCKGNYANGAVVHEQSFHYYNDEFITIVWWENEEPIWKFLEASEMDKDYTPPTF